MSKSCDEALWVAPIGVVVGGSDPHRLERHECLFLCRLWRFEAIAFASVLELETRVAILKVVFALHRQDQFAYKKRSLDSSRERISCARAGLNRE